MVGGGGGGCVGVFIPESFAFFKRSCIVELRDLWESCDVVDSSEGDGDGGCGDLGVGDGHLGADRCGSDDVPCLAAIFLNFSVCVFQSLERDAKR